MCFYHRSTICAKGVLSNKWRTEFNSMSSADSLVLASVFASAAYLWFKKLEPTDPFSLVVLLGVGPALPIAVHGLPFTSIVCSVFASYATYYISLLLLTALYRLSPLHPLYKYPGPTAGKLSKLWLVYKSSRGRLNEYFKQVHEKYGPIVRLGPNELSIVDDTLLPSIIGAQGMPKGPLWDGRRTNRNMDIDFIKANLIGARDLKQHADARKSWNRAFTSSSVKTYEPILIRRTTQLIDELRTKCINGKGGRAHVDLALWLGYFSLDFMGDFVFSGAFELMRDGDKQGLVPLMEAGTYIAALTQHIPWCLDIISFSPTLFRLAFGKMKGLGEFAFRQAIRRMKEVPMQSDLMYYLNEEGQMDSNPPPAPLVLWSAVIAVIAGSDGPASALSNAVYELLCNPQCFERLRAEVDSAFPPNAGEPINTARLSRMEYLNAFINEVLRLHPPIATCLQRAPTEGSGGHMLGSSIFIPEGVAVYAAPYVYQRDPRYFAPDPDRFWPERWLSAKDTDIVVNTNAYIPFSIGPANCVGKPLALIQLRMVIAYFVQAFDVCFAEGYDKQCWETELRDYFITHRGSLPVILTPRPSAR